MGNGSVEDRKWLVVRLLICLLKRMSGIDIECDVLQPGNNESLRTVLSDGKLMSLSSV